MKKFLCVILFCVICLCGVVIWHPSEPSFLPEYALSLPQDIVLEEDIKSPNATLFQDGQVIGGVIACPYSKKVLKATEASPISSGNFVEYSEFIITTLETAGVPGTGSPPFDRMMDSSILADCDLWLGSPEEEYQHYLYFFEDGILTLWLDLTLVNRSEAAGIVDGFSVTR